jgi:exodeoxyribonuclease VII small subunit
MQTFASVFDTMSVVTKKLPSTTGHDSTEDPPSLSFEEAMQELELIVRSLESGSLPLEESLRQYERGIERLRRCQQHLDQAKQRIEVLAGIDEEGKAILRPFTDEVGDDLVVKQGARSKRRTATDGEKRGGRSAMDEGDGLF